NRQWCGADGRLRRCIVVILVVLRDDMAIGGDQRLVAAMPDDETRSRAALLTISYLDEDRGILDPLDDRQRVRRHGLNDRGRGPCRRGGGGRGQGLRDGLVRIPGGRGGRGGSIP